jgi:hypothetical protein
MRFASTRAISAGVSSPFDGSNHSPRSSRLPTISGRVRACQL